MHVGEVLFVSLFVFLIAVCKRTRAPQEIQMVWDRSEPLAELLRGDGGGVIHKIKGGAGGPSDACHPCCLLAGWTCCELLSSAAGSQGLHPRSEMQREFRSKSKIKGYTSIKIFSSLGLKLLSASITW